MQRATRAIAYRARRLFMACLRLLSFAVIACLAGAVAACDEPTPLHLVAPELATPPPPAGASRVGRSATSACAGHSDDPPSSVLAAAVDEARGGSTAAYGELLVLALSWPHSATVRLRAADAAREPGDALRLYADAIRLHDAQCTLPPDDLREALHGLGAGRLSAGDLPGARAAFARALAEFPSDAAIRYAYAATLCRLHENDACARELLSALQADGSENTLRVLAPQDPDFESVRTDPRLRSRLQTPLQ